MQGGVTTSLTDPGLAPDMLLNPENQGITRQILDVPF